jgi:5-methylcytosine-specific restriction endonuclease McrA
LTTNAQWETTTWLGRYYVRLGKRVVSQSQWKKKEFRILHATQTADPVPLLIRGKRRLWYFHNAFYWDDDNLEAQDVEALLLQRERRLQQKLQTARSLMRADEAGKPTRVPIPTELRRAVFERDGGRCVECGSNFDLQYDHLLPVALGGATTIENLQLLCADCNRRKSDSL